MNPTEATEELATTALAAWDVRVDRIELASASENLVYRVTATTGERLAVRVHRPGYHTPDELASEGLWTTALAAAGVPVVASIPTADGAHHVEVGLPGTGETRWVGLSDWIDGTSLATAIEGADDRGRVEHYRSLGRLIATMHDHAATWPAPAGFVRHAFDADGLAGDRPFWGRFWETAEITATQRRLFAAARGWLHERLSTYPVDDGYSMIHGDLHPANVLLVDGEPWALDFDDAGFGWHAYDLAVALFFDADEPHYDERRDALVAGYRSVRVLPDEHLDRLPALVLARTLAIVGWLGERPDVPFHGLLPHFVDLACQRSTALLPE